jgi:hypothetical protein
MKISFKSITTIAMIAASTVWSSGVAAGECETDVSACSIKELCSAATTVKRNHLEWNFEALDHVVSAKSYGLNCGVDKPVKPVEDQVGVQAKFKKNDFTSLNQLKRHQIQYALKRLGYYSSGVDGLWGKGTERAVNKFMLDENIKTNLATNVYKALISTVDVSKVALKQKKVKIPQKIKPDSTKSTTEGSNNNTKICRLDDSERLDALLSLNNDLVSRTKKEFNKLREIEIIDGKLLIAGKKIKSNDHGFFKTYIKVLCEVNSNDWSRCGSFTAQTRLKIYGNNTVKGKLITPWEWAARSANSMKLEYTCSKG